MSQKMKPMKDIVHNPISECPLCNSTSLLVSAGGKKFLFGKEPDAVVCSDCGAVFQVSQDGMHIRYSKIPSPFAFFSNYYSGWHSPDDVAELAHYINTNSESALSYLSGAKKYAWAIRIILGAEGEADEEGMQLVFSWEGEPQSKNEAKREIAKIRQIQKEIRQVKREMNQEMKEIRARYGRRKENQAAKAAALRPYEKVIVIADNLLVQLDRAKLDIQSWIEDNF